MSAEQDPGGVTRRFSQQKFIRPTHTAQGVELFRIVIPIRPGQEDFYVKQDVVESELYTSSSDDIAAD